MRWLFYCVMFLLKILVGRFIFCSMWLLLMLILWMVEWFFRLVFLNRKLLWKNRFWVKVEVLCG